jgi:hypothetical protein
MVDIQLQTELVLETQDRVGVVAEVSRLLCDMGINLVSIVVKRNGDSVSLRLVTSSQSHAFDALKDAGFCPKERRVILMEIPHHPGFLSRMSEALARKGIAIEELHATVSDDSPTGLVVLRCSDNAKAVLLLRGK